MMRKHCESSQIHPADIQHVIGACNLNEIKRAHAALPEAGLSLLNHEDYSTCTCGFIDILRIVTDGVGRLPLSDPARIMSCEDWRDQHEECLNNSQKLKLMFNYCHMIVSLHGH